MAKLRFFTIVSALLSSLLFTPTAFAGGSNQIKDGLTCHNNWNDKTGKTSCAGNNHTKWRLRVRCKWQGDYTGPWNYGPGRDAFQCNFGVQGASVEWG